MAITFVDSSGVHVDLNGGALGNNISLTGLLDDDLLLCFLTCYDQTGGTITPPAGNGWTELMNEDYTPSDSWQHAIYWRLSDGAESWNFTVPAAYTNQIGMAWRDTHLTTPFPDTGSANSGSSATATGATMDVTNSGSFLIASMNGYSVGLSAGFTGMTARESNYDSVNNIYDESVSAGATGTRTASMASSSQWAVTMVAISPPGGGGGGGAVATPDHSSFSSFPALCRKVANDNGRWMRGKGDRLWRRAA